MKRFTFRLDGVLRLREYELEWARRQWQQLEAERRQRADRVETLERRLVEGRSLLDAELRRGTRASRLSLRARGLVAGRFELARAQARLEEIRPAVEQAVARLREARVRVRSLERLRETKAAAHRQQALRVWQAELEELSSARLARAGAESEGPS